MSIDIKTPVFTDDAELAKNKEGYYFANVINNNTLPLYSKSDIMLEIYTENSSPKLKTPIFYTPGIFSSGEVPAFSLRVEGHTSDEVILNYIILTKVTDITWLAKLVHLVSMYVHKCKTQFLIYNSELYNDIKNTRKAEILFGEDTEYILSHLKSSEKSLQIKNLHIFPEPNIFTRIKRSIFG